MFKNGISLRAQFYTLVISMTFLAFSLSLLNSAYTFKDYLNDQLRSHAQDAAHNLGLAIISQDTADNVLIETLAKSIFDSGYYQEISYVRADGVQIVNLSHQKPHNVPAWFLNLLPIEAPLMESELLDGWLIHGILKVRSHTGLAEQSLYNEVKRKFYASLLLFIIATIFCHFILRAILHPLQLILEQAQAVARKNFIINPLDTSTTELKAVLQALNVMVKNISQVFNEQTITTEKLIKQAYVDPLTELPNRRAFIDNLAGLQREATVDRNNLYVALIKLPSLKQLNTLHSVTAGDDYIKLAAKLLKNIAQRHSNVKLFRIAGSEFVLVAPCDSLTAKTLDEELIKLADFDTSSFYPQDFAITASVLAEADETFAHLLSRLDVSQAQHRLHLPVECEVKTAIQRAEWLELITHFINNTEPQKYRLELLLLPVMGTDNKVLYTESLIRFLVDDTALPTTEVIGMANHLDMGEALEKCILAFLLNKLALIKNSAIAINISVPALSNSQLYHWLLISLQQKQQSLPKLLVEIPEHAILTMPEQAKALIEQLKKLNIDVVVERFAGNFASLQHIRNLNIDYVKVDPSLTQELENQHNKLILASLTQICHSIGIKVLATHLEKPSCIAVCKEIHMDGFQGFGLCKTVNFSTLEKKLDANTAPNSYNMTAILAKYGENEA